MDPSLFLALGMPGPVEWVIILVVALLLFGRRLPEVMRGLGGGVREFRKGIDGSDEATSSSSKVEHADQPVKHLEPADTATKKPVDADQHP